MKNFLEFFIKVSRNICQFILLENSIGDHWMAYLTLNNHSLETENSIKNVCVCAQSCPMLFGPMDCSLPGSEEPMEFSRQRYWYELPFPTPRDLPDLGTEPMFLASPVLAGRFFTTSTMWEASKV